MEREWKQRGEEERERERGGEHKDKAESLPGVKGEERREVGKKRDSGSHGVRERENQVLDMEKLKGKNREIDREIEEESENNLRQVCESG